MGWPGKERTEEDGGASGKCENKRDRQIQEEIWEGEKETGWGRRKDRYDVK